jgi:hypothetical protein
MVVLFEPSELDIEFIHPESQHILKRTGWPNFFEKIDGYNIEVTNKFALYFDGEKTQIGNLHFKELNFTSYRITTIRREMVQE